MEIGIKWKKHLGSDISYRQAKLIFDNIIKPIKPADLPFDLKEAYQDYTFFYMNKKKWLVASKLSRRITKHSYGNKFIFCASTLVVMRKATKNEFKKYMEPEFVRLKL